MPSVLFVCTGNICRSPMAAALFKSKLGASLKSQGWVVESAGTWAQTGAPASPNSRRVMEGWGLDIWDHRSRRVDQEMLEGFDLILTMEAGHQEAILAEFPQLAGRVLMLSEMAGRYLNIVDPIGSDLAAYEATAREIDHLLNQGFKRILKLAMKDHK